MRKNKIASLFPTQSATARIRMGVLLRVASEWEITVLVVRYDNGYLGAQTL